MGGAALGAHVSDGPHAIVPGSLGVFGGTFDPIHVAHLAVAEEAAEALGLERVAVRPGRRAAAQAGLARSRPPRTAWRWSSSRSPATSGSRVDRREIDRPGPSYTVDTLASLHASRDGGGAGGRSDARSCRPRRSSG